MTDKHLDPAKPPKDRTKQDIWAELVTEKENVSRLDDIVETLDTQNAHMRQQLVEITSDRDFWIDERDKYHVSLVRQKAINKTNTDWFDLFKKQTELHTRLSGGE